jgi:hypothetical protein
MFDMICEKKCILTRDLSRGVQLELAEFSDSFELTSFEK